MFLVEVQENALRAAKAKETHQLPENTPHNWKTNLRKSESGTAIPEGSAQTNTTQTSTVEDNSIFAVPAQPRKTLEQVQVPSKKNCKVYADIGIHLRMFRKPPAVLETGEGMNFVRKSGFADSWNLKFKPTPTPEVCEANE